MIELRKSGERGQADHGWLRSQHSFSFAGYNDPRHMGFGPLRVLNEDRVAPGQGFGTHAHQDMDIISYVLDGALEHKDSLGTGSVIRRGAVQRMSAGTGVRHSEFNHSTSEPVHFLQVWIIPSQRGLAPSYEEKFFDDASKRDRLCLIASPDGREGSVSIHSQSWLFASLLSPGQGLRHEIDQGRLAYLHVVTGKVSLNGIALGPGDAAKANRERLLEIKALDEAELLLFDLPP
jgi:hypothetical protein